MRYQYGHLCTVNSDSGGKQSKLTCYIQRSRSDQERTCLNGVSDHNSSNGVDDLPTLVKDVTLFHVFP